MHGRSSWNTLATTREFYTYTIGRDFYQNDRKIHLISVLLSILISTLMYIDFPSMTNMKSVCSTWPDSRKYNCNTLVCEILCMEILEHMHYMLLYIGFFNTLNLLSYFHQWITYITYKYMSISIYAQHGQFKGNMF